MYRLSTALLRSALSDLRFKRYSVVVASCLLAVGGVALVLGRQYTHDIALGWDSINYLSVARSLLAGDGFVSFHGQYLDHPPLYPVLLALGGFGIFDPHEIAGILHAVIFGLIVFIASFWMCRRISSGTLVTFGCVGVMLSLPVTGLAATALAGIAFILFTIVSLMYADKFLHRSSSYALVLSAIFAALACLTRYVGVSLPAFVTLLILCYPHNSFRRRMAAGAAYAVIAIGPICVWLLWNMYISGSPTRHEYSFRSPLPILDDIVAVFSGWLLPGPSTANALADRPPEPSYIEAALVGMVLLMLLMVFAQAVAFAGKSKEQNDAAISITVFGGFSLFYIVFLVMLMSVINVGSSGRALEPRYLTPAYIPSLISLLLASGLRNSSGPRSEPFRFTDCRSARARMFVDWMNFRHAFNVFVCCTLAGWLVWQATLQAEILEKVNQDGRYTGYSSGFWVNSPILCYIQENQFTHSHVYSNNTGVLYLYTDSWSTFQDLPRGKANLRAWLRETKGDAHIVWLSCCDFGLGYDLPDLYEFSNLEVVAEQRDGVVFSIHKVN